MRRSGAMVLFGGLALALAGCAGGRASETLLTWLGNEC